MVFSGPPLCTNGSAGYLMQLGVKGCGMGPLLVLVTPCFRENVVSHAKLGLFCVV